MVRFVVFDVFQEPFYQYIVVVFCDMICADLEVRCNLVLLDEPQETTKDTGAMVSDSLVPLE